MVAGRSGVTVTAAVCVTPVPFTVAEIVLPWARVELKVAVNTPLPSAAPDAAGAKVLLVPSEDRATVAPGITLLNASRAVTVIVDAVVPATHAVAHAVMLAVPAATLEVTALALAAFTTTLACCVIA